jgi:prephenate dehydrogenase
MARVNVTLIGLQRIGASLGLALKRHMKTSDAQHEFFITGSDENRDSMRTATSLGAIDHETRDPAEAAEKADVVFVSTRYGITKDIFSIIGPVLKAGAVVVDLSPLKVPSIAWAKQHFRKSSEGNPEAYLVGITPLVNADYLTDTRLTSDAARADMFDQAGLIISPAANCPEEAVQLVADIADVIGLKVHFTDPAEHDTMIAAMETVPLLLNMALFRSVVGSSGWEDLQRFGNLPFALGTYRLFTDKPEDVAALMEHNRSDVIRALESLIASLREVTDLVHTTDAETVGDAFATTSEQYMKWRVARFTNKWKEDLDLPSAPSAGLLGPFVGKFRFGGNKSENDPRNPRK